MVVQHGENHRIPKEHHVHRTGGWLPADHRVQREWLDRQVQRARDDPKDLLPVLQEFKDFIEGNTRIFMYFTAMFEEVPNKKPYNKDPTGTIQIRDYHQMLQVLNVTFSDAPRWLDAAESVGMVGVPLMALLDWPMATPSGHAAFLDPDVNKMIKKVLDSWGRFLRTPESADVLGEHPEGWFGPTGKRDLVEVANAPLGTSHDFEDIYHCDPSKKHYGYKSWDDFFTRQIKDEVRPVASPDDDNVIANACESKVFNLQRNCNLRDMFWNKGQPYSILDMLAQDPLAHEFAGGTIYQAFLSALSYHRWHSPVSGTIKKALVEPGTYFSEPFDSNEIDQAGLADGQGYLAALATRAIIFIEADNPAIGLMAFIGIGMDEVSTCEITVKEGQHVGKGEQTGSFHYGGSSHCVLFRKGVNVDGFPSVGRKENVPVRGRLAFVS